MWARKKQEENKPHL